MQEFRESLLILVSLPIYIIVIGGELLYSYFHQKQYYTGKGILANIYLSALNFGLDILVRGICLFILDYFYQFKFFEIQRKSSLNEIASVALLAVV